MSSETVHDLAILLDLRIKKTVWQAGQILLEVEASLQTSEVGQGSVGQ